MTKIPFKKTLLFAFSIIFLLVVTLENALAAKGELGDESWVLEKRINRVFYFTHGTVVWGHEFGFFKADDCESDTLWLTFSSSEEKVKDFQGKEVVILPDVDKKAFRIKIDMSSITTIGVIHVMLFTGWRLEKQLVDALMKGRYVKVQILEPKELEALMDIKEDQFGLRGFTVCRKKAGKVCKDSLIDIGGEK